MVNIQDTLWVEKYRPKTTSEYVFTDDDQKEQVLGWIKAGSIPHLLFSGSAGTGKTTLAKVLIEELHLEGTDVLYVNGSKEGRKIDWLRTTLENFCQTMPFGSFKIVVVDEADYLNAESVQPALRNLMETYSQSVRFILTCNYPHRIIEPLQDRCQHFVIQDQDKDEFTARLAEVLISEGVTVETEEDLDLLDAYVGAAYPSLRKALNLLQKNVKDGSLVPPKDTSSGSEERLVEASRLMKQRKIREAREVLCKNIRPDEMRNVWRWMYDNLELWGDDDASKDAAILVIKQCMMDSMSAPDPEILISATLVALCGDE